MKEVDDLNRKPTKDDREYFSYTRNKDGKISKRVKFNDGEGSITNTLKFWEMKGLNITEVEDMFNFDFVVTGNCVPVVDNGKLVIIGR